MKPFLYVFLVGALALPAAASAQPESEGSFGQAIGGLALGAYSGLFVGDLVDNTVVPEDDNMAFVLGGALVGAVTGTTLGATSDGRVANGAKGWMFGFAGGAILSTLLLDEGDTGPLWFEGGLYGAAIGTVIGFALSTSSGSDGPSTSLVVLRLSF